MHILKEVKTPLDFRKWLEENGKTESECFILLKRGNLREGDTLGYLEALEVALCFGWIDSTCRAAEDGLSLQRFSPRKKGSTWTELNKARVERLIGLGLMTEEGRKAFELAKEFKIDAEVSEAFGNNPKAAENFKKFPILYQKVRIDTVQMYKKDRNQFEKRLAKLIENSEEGVMFGEWNDGGKLR